jgi:multiple sugar transport system ATP-binding protein
MARIFLERVSKVYDKKVTAVSDFTLDVPDGQFMVIVGPSGSGKSTILRLIAGLEKADSGNIYIDGVSVNNLAPKDRDVAMVFQNYTLYPHMTAYQNMAFALKMYKLPKDRIKSRIEQAAKWLDIENLLSRKPHAMSGGQRQRVALGKAIVLNPKVFLFDEPLSNLDPQMRLAMRAEIKTFHRRLKATIIYVTHDQGEAMSLGEQVCVINNGVIQQVDTGRRIYEQPVNIFVAGFFGTPPMNFFSGQLKLENESVGFVMGRDTLMLPKHLYKSLYDYRDKEMLLGVRPENISLSMLNGQQNNAITATVEIIEPAGSTTGIYFNCNGAGKYIASARPDLQLHASNPLKMYIDMQKILMFEPGQPGRNVTITTRMI